MRAQHGHQSSFFLCTKLSLDLLDRLHSAFFCHCTIIQSLHYYKDMIKSQKGHEVT